MKEILVRVCHDCEGFYVCIISTAGDIIIIPTTFVQATEISQAFDVVITEDQDLDDELRDNLPDIFHSPNTNNNGKEDL
jgi:hypothetical protein